MSIAVKIMLSHSHPVVELIFNILDGKYGTVALSIYKCPNVKRGAAIRRRLVLQ